MMFSLIPQSTATTLNFGFAVREYQRFLQLTLCTASWETGVFAIISSAFSLGVSLEVMRTRREPKSRILRVSFLVSMPDIPGMLFSSSSSESVFV